MFLKILLNTFQVCLLFIGLYYFVIGVFSLTIVKKNVKNPKKNSFAMLVAAHNEESVISDLVESLKNLDYPKEKYEIFVVADNCTDKTAELARECGATVWERFNDEKRGKGYAMEFAFERLFKLEKGYEYICVFDADNLVKKDFLVHMNDKINEGYRAVQGYIDSKNPFDTWLTFSYSLWYWIYNRLSQLSRGNLDMGCRLGGTGFAVSQELIKEYGWGATCLAEDTEFTLKLALNGIKVGWAHESVVYDEKPLRMETSIHQRQRWAQGLSEVATNYVKPLIKKTIEDKSLMAFNMLMNFWGDTLQTASVLILAVIGVLTFVLDESSVIFTMVCEIWTEPWRMLLLGVFIFGTLFLIVAGLYSDDRLDGRIVKNLLGFLVYIVSWIPIGIMGALKKDSKEWFHTPHSSRKDS